jgi:hypothetical protein
LASCSNTLSSTFHANSAQFFNILDGPLTTPRRHSGMDLNFPKPVIGEAAQSI